MSASGSSYSGILMLSAIDLLLAALAAALGLMVLLIGTSPNQNVEIGVGKAPFPKWAMIDIAILHVGATIQAPHVSCAGANVDAEANWRDNDGDHWDFPSRSNIGQQTVVTCAVSVSRTDSILVNAYVNYGADFSVANGCDSGMVIIEVNTSSDAKGRIQTRCGV